MNTNPCAGIVARTFILRCFALATLWSMSSFACGIGSPPGISGKPGPQCGGSSAHGGRAHYVSVSGSVSGLTASGLVLAVNLGGATGTVRIPAGQASYSITSQTASNLNYAVSVQTQPSGLNCVVDNASGTFAGTYNVTNANVRCGTSHTVTAAAPAGSNGTITPPSQSVDYGGTATFTVTPYPNQAATVSGDTCTVIEQGTTTTWTSNDIVQDCSVTATFQLQPPTYAIGGALSGASGSVSLTLDSTNPNSTQSQTLTSNSRFAFDAALQQGSNWAISVQQPPSGQICTVSNGSGTNLQGPVSNVIVTCVLAHVVNANIDGYGAITPASQYVADSTTATFTITPDVGFDLAGVVVDTGDTCTVTQQGTSTTWITNAITQDCSFTATFVDHPSQCSGATNFNPSFFDNFAGLSLDTSLWTAATNGGSINVANNTAMLSAPSPSPQFPFVTSVGSPIPSGGSFSVRWIAAYTGAAGAGDGTLVLSKGLPSNDANDDYSLRRADAWQDSTNGFNVRMRSTDAGTYGPILTPSTPPPVNAIHDIEYCYLPNVTPPGATQPGTVEVWIDGALVQQVSNIGLSRPDSLWFGNPVNAGSGGVWNPFTLYYVEVRALNDEIFYDGFGD